MLDSFKAPLIVAGRILLALMFVLAGFDKFTHIQGSTAYMASGGLPAWSFLIVLVALLELLGGLAVATGFYARWAALALGVFTLLASFLFHAFWAVPAEQHLVTQLLFMKNISVAGGMFVLAALGPGPASLGMSRASQS